MGEMVLNKIKKLMKERVIKGLKCNMLYVSRDIYYEIGNSGLFCFPDGASGGTSVSSSWNEVGELFGMKVLAHANPELKDQMSITGGTPGSPTVSRTSTLGVVVDWAKEIEPKPELKCWLCKINNKPCKKHQK